MKGSVATASAMTKPGNSHPAAIARRRLPESRRRACSNAASTVSAPRNSQVLREPVIASTSRHSAMHPPASAPCKRRLAYR
jgi:hypothetical protein